QAIAKDPFPQAQMLDSRAVLHERHDPVNNPERGMETLDNALKIQLIRDKMEAATARSRTPNAAQAKRIVPIWPRAAGHAGCKPRAIFRRFSARHEVRFRQSFCASARFPKFVTQRSTLLKEFRKAKGTSKSVILVPLFDLKFLIEFAVGGAGTSNRRH
ncbi:MAG TPA: hypothetical protein VMN03_01490, partial [Burkholderiales bacterium]|nr:hypothetical protein [Burkholderiales bacterium]